MPVRGPPPRPGRWAVAATWSTRGGPGPAAPARYARGKKVWGPHPAPRAPVRPATGLWGPAGRPWSRAALPARRSRARQGRPGLRRARVPGASAGAAWPIGGPSPPSARPGCSPGGPRSAGAGPGRGRANLAPASVPGSGGRGGRSPADCGPPCGGGGPLPRSARPPRPIPPRAGSPSPRPYRAARQSHGPPRRLQPGAAGAGRKRPAWNQPPPPAWG